MSDLISRQAVLDALNNIEIPRNASWYQYYQQALTAVGKLQPAQPERIRGRWIYHPEWANDGECGYECSVCHMGSDIDYNFCMRCGADMREVTI